MDHRQTQTRNSASPSRRLQRQTRTETSFNFAGVNRRRGITAAHLTSSGGAAKRDTQQIRKIHDCVAVGTNTGLRTGFTNGLGGFADAKNCQFYNNTAIDVQGVFYNDTGTLENIRIANNTLVRGWFGIGLVADGPNESWTKNNIVIVDNKLDIQNRNAGDNWGIAIYGATSSNVTIAGNYISFDPTGNGALQFLTIGVLDS